MSNDYSFQVLMRHILSKSLASFMYNNIHNGNFTVPHFGSNTFWFCEGKKCVNCALADGENFINRVQIACLYKCTPFTNGHTSNFESECFEKLVKEIYRLKEENIELFI